MTVRELIAELHHYDEDMIVAKYSPVDQAFVEIDGYPMQVDCKKMLGLYHQAYDNGPSEKILTI